MIRPASLAAFARDVAHATAFGTIVAALADYATENRCLRAKVAEFDAENDALADMVNDLAGQLARAVRHPSVRHLAPPVSVARVEITNLDEIAASLGIDLDSDDEPVAAHEMADAMTVLESDDLTASDLLWQWGGEVK